MKFNPAVLIMAGSFSLFFLVSGVRALVRKRMTVVNPSHSGAWPGLLGKAVLYIVLGVALLGLGIFATLVENDVL
ncbi:hypothetical protein KH5H1_27720 [Corallococcus caeni]|uniref:hypothetical protein n=1 Tax=Corallococcus caeni TaxID=3082388 RepID=UPI0029575982|nr:hypothetical protein KH5H1_27720 [Corallococcus sp. KH5-1]